MTDYYNAIISFALCLCLIPGLKRLAIRFGLTDHPSDRKHHAGQIPLCGGIAIFTAGKANNKNKPNQETGIHLHAASGQVSLQSQSGKTTAARSNRVAGSRPFRFA